MRWCRRGENWWRGEEDTEGAEEAEEEWPDTDMTARTAVRPGSSEGGAEAEGVAGMAATEAARMDGRRERRQQGTANKAERGSGGVGEAEAEEDVVVVVDEEDTTVTQRAVRLTAAVSQSVQAVVRGGADTEDVEVVADEVVEEAGEAGAEVLATTTATQRRRAERS